MKAEPRNRIIVKTEYYGSYNDSPLKGLNEAIWKKRIKIKDIISIQEERIEGQNAVVLKVFHAV